MLPSCCILLTDFKTVFVFALGPSLPMLVIFSLKLKKVPVDMVRKGPRAKTKTVLKSVSEMQQLGRGGWVISERAIFLHILISSWIGGTIRIQYHQSGQMASDVCLPWWVHIDIDIVIMINDNDEWTSGMAKWVNWCVTVFTLCGLTLGWHLMI